MKPNYLQFLCSIADNISSFDILKFSDIGYVYTLTRYENATNTSPNLVWNELFSIMFVKPIYLELSEWSIHNISKYNEFCDITYPL